MKIINYILRIADCIVMEIAIIFLFTIIIIPRIALGFVIDKLKLTAKGE
jgi:hypothetical protein